MGKEGTESQCWGVEDGEMEGRGTLSASNSSDGGNGAGQMLSWESVI